jgi:hypothetical protein
MRLGKRERAQQKERVIASHNVASLMGQDKFFMSHTGKVCQNIKGSFTKHKTSQALFDICQRVK